VEEEGGKELSEDLGWIPTTSTYGIARQRLPFLQVQPSRADNDDDDDGEGDDKFAECKTRVKQLTPALTKQLDHTTNNTEHHATQWPRTMSHCKSTHPPTTPMHRD